MIKKSATKKAEEKASFGGYDESHFIKFKLPLTKETIENCKRLHNKTEGKTSFGGYDESHFIKFKLPLSKKTIENYKRRHNKKSS